MKSIKFFIGALTVVTSLNSMAGVGEIGSGNVSTSTTGSCSDYRNDVMTLLDIQTSLVDSMIELQTLSNNSQNKEQQEVYNIQLGELRAEYIKCDLILTHARLLNK